jgi:hypothetical protein
MAKKLIRSVYSDEHTLLENVRYLRGKGVKIVNVFSPFPVHGLDQALGLRRTRLSTAAFIYGLTGTSLALLMMWFMLIYDWPMNIGGKPSFSLMQNLPSFIPITFELTVLCAAHGMVITFLLASKLFPGVTPYVAHPRVTDDKLVILIETDDNNSDELMADLKNRGAEEILT